LVIAGQPYWQVDVKIGRSIRCVTCSEIGQGAVEMIDSQYCALDEHEDCQSRGQPEAAQHTCNRQGQDAAREKEPDYSMKEPDFD